jgi:hypothetical protein
MLWLLICSPGDGCGQFQQRSRAGAAALVVIVAGCLGRCRARSGGQLHQQGRAGAAALVVIAVAALAGAVLDAVASSTSSTSKGGPALSS